MNLIFEDRALVLELDDISILVISDLHLGYEIDLSERTGTHFPYQHEKMLERIVRLVSEYSIEWLYIIGDVKHTIHTDSSYNWRTIPEFMERVVNYTPITIIPGNHDGNLGPLLPRSIKITETQGTVLETKEERIGFLHGHAWPSDDVLQSKLIVVGHNHPNVRRVLDVSSLVIGRSERRRSSHVVPVVMSSKLNRDCVRSKQGKLELNDGDATLLTLPPFNDLITGVSINRSDVRFQGPLFENDCADLLTSEVFSLEGVFLGTVETLRKQYNPDVK